MSLIGDYLNSVKSEEQKSNLGCQAAHDTKEVRYQNKKGALLNWNTILLYTTMTITINNSIITNKFLCARHSV